MKSSFTMKLAALMLFSAAPQAFAAPPPTVGSTGSVNAYLGNTTSNSASGSTAGSSGGTKVLNGGPGGVGYADTKTFSGDASGGLSYGAMGKLATGSLNSNGNSGGTTTPGGGGGGAGIGDETKGAGTGIVTGTHTATLATGGSTTTTTGSGKGASGFTNDGGSTGKAYGTIVGIGVSGVGTLSINPPKPNAFEPFKSF